MDNRNAGIKIKQKSLKLGQFLAFEHDWEGMVDWIQDIGFIPDSKNCENCGRRLIIQESRKNKDGCIWR